MPQTRLHAQLTATTAVTDIVGQRVYPIKVTQGTALPHITYQVISDVSINHAAGATETNNTRIQVDCWAATYDVGRTLAKAVKDALKNWTDLAGDPAISSCHYEDGQDAPEPVLPGEDRLAAHRVRQDYMLWYNANP